MQGDGEVRKRGIIVRRPRKERIRNVALAWFTVIVHIVLTIYLYHVRTLLLFEWIITLSIEALILWRVIRFVLEEVEEQTYLIDETGITNYRYGKRRERVSWDSLVAIEAHHVVIESRAATVYQAIICSKIPIKTKINSEGLVYVPSSFHLHKGRSVDVIELVLDEEQYLEFLRCIPQSVVDKGIVKL